MSTLSLSVEGCSCYNSVLKMNLSLMSCFWQQLQQQWSMMMKTPVHFLRVFQMCPPRKMRRGPAIVNITLSWSTLLDSFRVWYLAVVCEVLNEDCLIVESKHFSRDVVPNVHKRPNFSFAWESKHVLWPHLQTTQSKLGPCNDSLLMSNRWGYE